MVHNMKKVFWPCNLASREISRFEYGRHKTPLHYEIKLHHYAATDQRKIAIWKFMMFPVWWIHSRNRRTVTSQITLRTNSRSIDTKLTRFLHSVLSFSSLFVKMYRAACVFYMLTFILLSQYIKRDSTSQACYPRNKLLQHNQFLPWQCIYVFVVQQIFTNIK